MFIIRHSSLSMDSSGIAIKIRSVIGSIHGYKAIAEPRWPAGDGGDAAILMARRAPVRCGIMTASPSRIRDRGRTTTRKAFFTAHDTADYAFRKDVQRAALLGKAIMIQLSFYALNKQSEAVIASIE